jgi:hypothetical protein
LGTPDFVSAIKKEIVQKKEKINKEIAKGSFVSIKKDVHEIMILVAEKSSISPASILSRSKERNVSDALDIIQHELHTI